MKKTSYIKNKFPIFKRNHEKILIRLKPDTPISSNNNILYKTSKQIMKEQLQKNKKLIQTNPRVSGPLLTLPARPGPSPPPPARPLRRK